MGYFISSCWNYRKIKIDKDVRKLVFIMMLVLKIWIVCDVLKVVSGLKLIIVKN